MPPMVKRLLRSEPAQAALGRLLGLYIAFAFRTTRWRLDGAEHFAPHARGEPAVAAFWHERLPMMAMLWLFARRSAETRQRGTGMQILVSQHRDGVLVGRALRRFDIGVVTGSSTRGGAASVRALARLIAAGNHLAITPDGPRGPPRAAQTTRRWVLPGWDCMVLPKPFGRGVIVCGPTIAVPRENWQAALPAITAAIDAATETADRLCAA